MIQCVFEDEESLEIFAEEQCWDEETLEQLKNEYTIYFMTDSYGVSMRELDETLQRVNNTCADDLCKDDFGEFQPSDKPIEFLLGIPVNNKGGV